MVGFVGEGIILQKNNLQVPVLNQHYSKKAHDIVQLPELPINLQHCNRDIACRIEGSLYQLSAILESFHEISIDYSY